MTTTAVKPRDIKFYRLNANDSAKLRCQYLMENRMQCPTHASYTIGDDEYLCTYHFNLIKIVRTVKGELNFIEDKPDDK